MGKVLDYSLKWDINPNLPDSRRIVIITTKHTIPFRLPVNSPEEFLAAAHMLSMSSVVYNLDTGMLTVLQRPAGT